MSHITTTLLFIVLLVTLFSVIVMRASGGEASIFGYQLKSVLSGSMEPEIQTGSIIAINTDDAQDTFQKGDVITFQTNDDMVVTHRVAEVDNGHYVTKGDANDAPDVEPVTQESVIGEYTGFSIPYAGYVMTFANSKEGAAILLVLPGIFLIIYSIITIWRALRKIDQPEKEVKPDVKKGDT